MRFRLRANEISDRPVRRESSCGLAQGHDVIESRERGPDPGDLVLLEWAASESRILITIDTDFGQLIFQQGVAHCGLIRLPDVRANERLQILEDVLDRFSEQLSTRLRHHRERRQGSALSSAAVRSRRSWVLPN
jgi:predicted nuclease of predicted toxin-antitoxin system